MVNPHQWRNMKIISQDEFSERINNKYPNQPFEIIEYTRVSKPFTIKCLKCGKIEQYSTAGNFLNSGRKGLCSCYNENNNQNKHEKNKILVQELINKNSYLSFEKYGHDDKNKKFLVFCYCNHCQQSFSKPILEFLKYPDCPFCQGKEKMNTPAFVSNLSDEYELLEEYKNCETKIKIRHKCGFIWSILPKKMNNYIGCPHCNKRKSKGEQKIIQILLDKNIVFENEKSFEWQTNKLRRYDFYIPQYHLIIEYMGEQHYQEVPSFKYSLEEQKRIDEEKYLDAIKNGYNYLSIKYTDYNNLDEILTNWFNDYSERK